MRLGILSRALFSLSFRNKQVSRILPAHARLRPIAQLEKVYPCEQQLSLAQQDWRHGEVQFIDLAGHQVLANDSDAAPDPARLSPATHLSPVLKQTPDRR